MGSLLISLLLQSNDSYCYLVWGQRKKNGESRKKPQEKFLGQRSLRVRETPFMNRERTAKGYLCFFAEKDRSLDPQ